MHMVIATNNMRIQQTTFASNYVPQKMGLFMILGVGYDNT